MSYEIKVPEEKMSTSRTIIYSFIVVPFFIAFFGVFIMIMVKLVVGKPASLDSALVTISRGSESERWQAALDLVGLLRSEDVVELDRTFTDRMIREYNRAAGERTPYLRTYLALAMGMTHDQRFEPHLIEGLADADLPNKMAAIKALGLVGGADAEAALIQLLDHDEPGVILDAIISLGRLDRPSAIPALKQQLDHTEPNVRWDAAIALAKLGDRSGVDIINQLLNPNYYTQFPLVDVNEMHIAISIAIEMAAQLGDAIFQPNLMLLAEYNINLGLANAAMMALKEF